MKRDVQKKQALKKDVKAAKSAAKIEKGMPTGAAAPINPKKSFKSSKSAKSSKSLKSSKGW